MVNAEGGVEEEMTHRFNEGRNNMGGGNDGKIQEVDDDISSTNSSV